VNGTTPGRGRGGRRAARGPLVPSPTVYRPGPGAAAARGLLARTAGDPGVRCPRGSRSDRGSSRSGASSHTRRARCHHRQPLLLRVVGLLRRGAGAATLAPSGWSPTARHCAAGHGVGSRSAGGEPGSSRWCCDRACGWWRKVPRWARGRGLLGRLVAGALYGVSRTISPPTPRLPVARSSPGSRRAGSAARGRFRLQVLRDRDLFTPSLRRALRNGSAAIAISLAWASAPPRCSA
jgi:hypothetical protein